MYHLLMMVNRKCFPHVFYLLITTPGAPIILSVEAMVQ